MVRRVLSLACIGIALLPALGSAQTVAGTWRGAVSSAQGDQPLILKLDSTATGWSGTMQAPGVSDVTPLESVSISKDSLMFTLTAQGMSVAVAGKLAAGAFDGVLVLDGNPMGDVHLEQPKAPVVVAQATPRPAKRVYPSVEADSVHFVTSDITRFWNVFDSSTTTNAVQRYQELLDTGSPAYQDFVLTHIGNGFSFAKQANNEKARYEAVRAQTMHVADAEPAIRDAFRKLKALYPDAKFPDVYFVVGRFNTGGFTADHGVVIAAEMYNSPAQLAAIAAHEVVHAQQPALSGDKPATLLTRAFREGAADFVGQMISGGNINEPAYTYGKAHEHQLWLEFRKAMTGTDYSPWMYVKPADDRPNDLGYFIGYRIAEAYYNRQTNKAAAIKEILTATDMDALLKKSGYAP
jgi:hypothetical protein